MKNEIINWNSLTQEQKNKALKLIEFQTGLNSSVIHPAAIFFQKNDWVKIDNFIDKNTANILYHSVQLAAKRLYCVEEFFGVNNYDKGVWGTFDDHQAPGDYSKYGELIFDAILNISLEQIEVLTGKKLTPTYYYHRLYTTGTELKKHRDRSSCEISTTLCLGYDISNVDSKKHPNWNWPMFIKDKNNNEIPVHMNPGDMIIYRGCEVEHWREPFWGKNQAQVFLHYNEKQGNFDVPFDGRPALGLPVNFRSKEYEQKIEELNKKVYNEQLKYDSETKNKKIIY